LLLNLLVLIVITMVKIAIRISIKNPIFACYSSFLIKNAITPQLSIKVLCFATIINS